MQAGEDGADIVHRRPHDPMAEPQFVIGTLPMRAIDEQQVVDVTFLLRL